MFAGRQKYIFIIFICLYLLLSRVPEVCGDIIIDNGGPGTSYTGIWEISGGTASYGTGSLWARNGATYTWQFNPQPEGVYEVFMWWSGYSSRASNIAVQIGTAGGVSTVYINQQQKAGQWNSLGQYSFASGASVKIIAAQGSDLSTCADAVMIRPATAAETIIDNSTAGTSFTGSWGVSGAAGYYGGNSLWSRDGSTYTWSFTPTFSGNADISMWWTTWPSRNTNIPVDITHDLATTRVYINQQQNGAKWNVLGAYPFSAGKGYTVKLTAQPGPSSTCADAVKITPVSSGSVPTAHISLITPNPAPYRQSVQFDGSGSGGTITGYEWRSSVDGFLSSEASFSTAALSNGNHIIYFKVQNSEGWSSEVSINLRVIEHIYVCFGHAPNDAKPTFLSFLKGLGATQNGTLWTYRNETLNKNYIIHIVTNMAGMKQALTTQGAHVLFNGHSNYGLGPVFSTSSELNSQIINNLYYIDDDRIFNVSSPWINVNVHGMRTGQAYPFWWPVLKDGTSGIMPYDFDDPSGDPPYNYYHTYRLPGDPTYYLVEGVEKGAIARFSDAPNPAWYSSDGLPPDPGNPEHQQYFITNPTPWYPSFYTEGDWITSKTIAGYYRENYFYTPAGTGNRKAQWLFKIPSPGDYNVYAWWSASPLRTSMATYTISHSDGDTAVNVDQRNNGSQWNNLGQFYFDAGDYQVVLTDKASPGNVVADAVRVSTVNNLPEILQVNFYAKGTSGVAPLVADFSAEATGDVTDWSWDFGDGGTNHTRDSITHTYLKSGTYTVTLTGYGPLGSSTIKRSGLIKVGSAVPQLRAEFSADPRQGEIPLITTFRDRSSGEIVSWLWDFGDGETSSSQTPQHIYQSIGNYTVSLKVTDATGMSHTETKVNYIRAVIYEKTSDNVDYPKTHYGSKTILFRSALDVPEEELKYDRLFYLSCNSGNYFIDTFHRGIMHYDLNSTMVGGEIGFPLYLKAYFEGKTDEEIWAILQSYEAVFDFFDFSKLPSEQ